MDTHYIVGNGKTMYIKRANMNIFWYLTDYVHVNLFKAAAERRHDADERRAAPDGGPHCCRDH